MSIQSNFPNLQPSLLLDFANTKQLDNRVTFTRSTPAVYYDGKTTAMAEQNLLTYSQDFSNAAWTKYKASITANTTTAPDGTATASALVENNENFQHLAYRNNVANIVSTGSIATMSIYAKANSRSWINLNLYDGTNHLTWFDLTNGVVGTNASGNTAVITSVGNGWYRCTISRTIANAAIFGVEYGISPSDNTYSYTGDGTSNIYIWGAQTEQRSSATAYTATTTQPITNYIPVLLSAGGNQPRFDCNPTTGESLGLLIEEQRTNIALYSEQFENAVWNPSNVSVTPNTIVSPDGSLDGDKLYENTANSYHQIYQTFSTSTGVTYNATIYAKAGERSIIDLYLQLPGSVVASFNLITGVATQVIGTTNPTMTNVGNGWWRCSITSTATGATTGYMNVILNNGSTSFYTGNGFNGVYLWGAQLEAGSFATSYIATTSASATRTADAASMTGTNFSSWYNVSEGTIYCEAKYSSASQLSTVYIGDGGTSNAIWIGKDVGGTSSPADAEMYVRALSANQGFPLLSSTVGTAFVKLCGAYKTNDFAFSGNGATVATDTDGIVPVADRFLIGDYVYTTEKSQHIKKIAYYPIRVTNAQLQALTS